jgi:hypothetical protein
MGKITYPDLLRYPESIGKITYPDLLKYAEERGFERKEIAKKYQNITFEIVKSTSGNVIDLTHFYIHHGKDKDGDVSILKYGPLMPDILKRMKFFLKAKIGKQTVGYFVMHNDKMKINEKTASVPLWPAVRNGYRKKNISYFMLLAMMFACKEDKLFFMMLRNEKKEKGDTTVYELREEYIMKLVRPLGKKNFLIEDVDIEKMKGTALFIKL